MAVYGWIRGNAKIVGDGGDYLVRVCDLELKKYGQILISLSDRMLSTKKRRGESENQQCWFSGYLDKNMYVVATCAKQDKLLGISLAGGGFRELYCVLALGFTNEDIQLYRQDDSIFEPLKEIMRVVNRNNITKLKTKCIIEQKFESFIQNVNEDYKSEKYNIQKSTPLTDKNLWKQSLQRPVMTGIISLEDAKRLLSIFPNGIVTIMEDTEIKYCNNQEKKVNLEEQFEREKEEERREKIEQEKIEQEAEEARQAIIERQKKVLPEQRKSNNLWALPVIICLIFILFCVFNIIGSH